MSQEQREAEKNAIARDFFTLIQDRAVDRGEMRSTDIVIKDIFAYYGVVPAQRL